MASQLLARDDEPLPALLTQTIPVKLVVSLALIATTLAIVSIAPINANLKYFISISACGILFEACTPAWVFVALGRINCTSAIRIGQSLLSLIAMVIMVRTTADWKFLPFLNLFDSFVSFLLATSLLIAFKLYRFERIPRVCDYMAKLRSNYRESVHFLKADLSGYVYTTSDRLILYYFSTPYVVGIYDAAYKIIKPFYAINTIITPTMFREMAQAYKNGKAFPVMAKYLFTMSIFTIPLGFFLLSFADVTVNLLYGAKFIESVPSLKILGFVITFGFTSGVIAQPFCAWNMQREFGSSVFWGNVINTVLNFALIPYWGAVGAAIATLAAKILVTVVAYRYFVKALAYPLIKDFSYFFVASALPLMLVVVLAKFVAYDALLIAVYGVSYFAILFFMYRSYFQVLQRVPAGDA